MVLLLLIAVLAGSIWGCGMMQQKKGKEHAVEYTVLGEDQIPDEIRKVVDVKKQEEFQMTYQEEDMLYLLQGYGIQIMRSPASSDIVSAFSFSVEIYSPSTSL